MARAHGGDAVEERLQSVEDAVNNLAKVVSRAELAIKDAAKARVDAASALKTVAATEHRYRRRSRLLAAAAVVISVAAALGIAWWTNHRFDRINHDQAVSRYQQCKVRNAQAVQQARRTEAGLIYSIELFGAVKKTDPALARAIEAIPRPQREPSPALVRCPKP